MKKSKNPPWKIKKSTMENKKIQRHEKIKKSTMKNKKFIMKKSKN